MTKLVSIKCKASELVPLSDLKPFQGTLKTLSEKNERKLRANLQRNGIRFPFFYWQRNGDKLTLDGHQRAIVLTKMLDDGWEIQGGKVPADRIEAADEREAKRLILLAASQYGEVTEPGLLDFIKSAGISIEDIRLEVDLPKIDADIFEATYLKDGAGDQFGALGAGPGDPEFRQMTFVLHNSQAERVEAALSRVKKLAGESLQEGQLNENENGNALAFLAEAFLKETRP